MKNNFIMIIPKSRRGGSIFFFREGALVVMSHGVGVADALLPSARWKVQYSRRNESPQGEARLPPPFPLPPRRLDLPLVLPGAGVGKEGYLGWMDLVVLRSISINY